MFFRRNRNTSVKQFYPPEQFEYNLHLALRLLACESYGDGSLTIKAGRDGITMYVNGIRNLESLARTYAPGAYRYFFQHPTYNNGSLRLTFREPDCYIYGCPQEGMEFDLREHAPNAQIGGWYEKSGSKQIYINFRRYPCEEETARWDDFEHLYRIWCR